MPLGQLKMSFGCDKAKRKKKRKKINKWKLRKMGTFSALCFSDDFF